MPFVQVLLCVEFVDVIELAVQGSDT
jgi:hypothetical protein